MHTNHDMHITTGGVLQHVGGKCLGDWQDTLLNVSREIFPPRRVEWNLSLFSCAFSSPVSWTQEASILCFWRLSQWLQNKLNCTLYRNVHVCDIARENVLVVNTEQNTPWLWDFCWLCSDLYSETDFFALHGTISKFNLISLLIWALRYVV